MMNHDLLKRFLPQVSSAEYVGSMATFEVSASHINAIVTTLCQHEAISFKLIAATDERKDSGYFRIRYVFGVAKEGVFIVPFVLLKDGDAFSSIASLIPEAWSHERKLQDFFGIPVMDQARPQQILLHENWPADIFPLRKDFDGQSKPPEATGTYEFQPVLGEGIYEIPVGPIHAGIIEPGHFRFSVAGESIVQLEARLGYVHKGIEKLFEALPLQEKMHLSEKVSGDSSFAHSLAFCQALEQLFEIDVPKRGRYLRVIFAELERLANHFGDMGAMMLDTGFNFGGVHGARLRELVMRTNERLTGNRFLRGVNTIGGVQKDIDKELCEALLSSIRDIEKDFSEVIDASRESASLMNRLKGTGMISFDVAREIGITGVPARALGIALDTRVDFPYAAYDEIPLGGVEIENDGDVFARFRVRLKEARASFDIICRALQNFPEGAICATKEVSVGRKHAFAVSMVEGWRGEIAYFVATDGDGNIQRVVPRDPSFVNWPAVTRAVVDNIVPDFPLINKSFNLSYSGNDL